MLDATHTFETGTAEAIPAAAPVSSHAAPAAAAETAAERQVPLPLRHDTLLGVCEAIGQDFGFNANFLRILLGVGLFWSPLGMIGLYLGLGAVVAVSRWFFPAARPAAAEPSAEQPVEQAQLPLAA